MSNIPQELTEREKILVKAMEAVLKDESISPERGQWVMHTKSGGVIQLPYTTSTKLRQMADAVSRFRTEEKEAKRIAKERAKAASAFENRTGPNILDDFTVGEEDIFIIP